jgi:hypothetical protein
MPRPEEFFTRGQALRAPPPRGGAIRPFLKKNWFCHGVLFTLAPRILYLWQVEWRRNKRRPHPSKKGVMCMSHSRDVKKDVRKQPAKSLKEKRLEKQAKKASKSGGAPSMGI